MGKSSSKKKRSKHLSQGKTRKKGKTLSKRFSKSKGIRSRNDSDSSADDSVSSGYELSSSSSGDDNRNQKSRLRKIDVKSSKKKDRRVFSSSGSESEQETARSRKRKRSNKKDIFEPKKKNQRKKARRDETISDSSSFSSHESESDRRRSRSGRKKKVTRKMEKGKKKGYRSRSSSTCIVSSGSDDYQFEENTQPKRLRSVIIVVNDKEGTELDENEDKDRIVYDSPSREINGTDDCKDEREETILSNEKTQNDLQNHIPDLAVETNTVEEISNEAVKVDVVASVDDLESILRQRALENLKKFRGDLQTSAITTHADVKLKSDAMPNTKAEEIIGQTNSTKVESVKLNAATKAPVLKRVSSRSAQNEETRLEKKNNKLDVVAVPDLSNKKCSPTASAIGNNAKLAPLKEVNIPINPAKKTEIEAGVDNRSSERAESVEHHSCKNNGNTIHKASGSAPVPTPSLEPGLGNVVSNKEGSQLESKTMSVMRGGQMVEVNYQVYIPKKASALGRRPIKR